MRIDKIVGGELKKKPKLRRVKMNTTIFAEKQESFQTKTDCVLCLALDVGEGMLRNGDNVHHVEETIIRICNAYGSAHVETFVISTLILASVRMNDGSYSSQMRRVYDNVNNMSMLENFNSLSRRIGAEKPDFDTAQQMLRETKNKRIYSRWLTVLSSALGAGSSAILFGGSWRDGLAGGIVGLVLGLLFLFKLENITALAKTLIYSFIAGNISYLTVLARIGENADMVMIGSIMLLIPGLAFGNALRDLLCGDIMTGMLKTVQSCLTAALVACGYTGAMLIMNRFGVESGLPAIEYNFAIGILTALVVTLSFSAVFRVRPKVLWVAALGGGAAYGIYILFGFIGAPLFVCAFTCSLFAAIYAEVCARLCKVPAIVFLTPSIIPVVPGRYLYYTMSSLVNGNNGMIFEYASKTLSISAGIVVGSIFVMMIMTVKNHWNTQNGLK